MLNKTATYILIATILAFILASAYLFYIAKNRIISFLAKTQEVKGNILIVEGWLPQPALQKACEEFKKNKYDLILTTGLKSPDLDFYMLARNGYLIFYPGPELFEYEDEKNHMIEILAHSKMSGKYSSHFNVYVNDSLVADFFANEKREKFRTNWKGSLKDIDSIMVHFDNDFVDEYGDRNLYVKEIIFNNEIFIPYQFNTEYDIGLLDGKDRVRNDFESYAEIARNDLIAMGIDSSSAIAVMGKRTILNRTLTSIVAVRKYIESTDLKIEGINIITQGIHARRTLMTYRSVLNKSVEIGVISVSESGVPDPEELNFGYILAETLSLIYYRIILIPYEVLNVLAAGSGERARGDSNKYSGL